MVLDNIIIIFIISEAWKPRDDMDSMPYNTKTKKNNKQKYNKNDKIIYYIGFMVTIQKINHESSLLECEK